MSRTILSRSLCRPSRILFGSTLLRPLRKFTTESLVKDQGVRYDYKLSPTLGAKASLQADGVTTAWKLYRYLSKQVSQDTVYFIESHNELIMQGIVIGRKDDREKEIHGAIKIGGKDATSHLARALDLDSEKLDKIASSYANLAGFKAGSYFIVLDELDAPEGQPWITRQRKTYAKSKMRSTAWKMQYSDGMREDKETKFRAAVETKMKSWLMNKRLGTLNTQKTWKNRSVSNPVKWKKVRKAFNQEDILRGL